MRIGIVTDVHLAPAGTEPLAWHNPYALADAAERFEQALRLCTAEGAEVIALLGDLAHFGDAASLEAGVRIAAAAGRPVWLVPGNHDCTEADGALARAVARHGAGAVRQPPPTGVPLDGGWRLAGLGLVGDRGGLTARSTGASPVAAWGGDPVLLLSHYPLLSFAEEARRAGLRHPGDLGDLAEVAPPVLSRRAPTVVLHGHAHLRHASSVGPVLQLSCAALIEPPFEVTLLDLDVDPDDRSTTVHRRADAVAQSGAARLPILVPPEGRWRFDGGRWRPSADTAG